MPYKNKQDKLNHNHRYFHSWYERNGNIRNRSSNYVEKIREWQRKNIERVKCSRQLRDAVKMGRVTKPDYCQVCGKKKKLMGHHKDYNKPLVVDWLCASCHKLRHSVLNRLNWYDRPGQEGKPAPAP